MNSSYIMCALLLNHRMMMMMMMMMIQLLMVTIENKVLTIICVHI